MKTIEQEILEGNPGRRPIPENAPRAKGEIPNPPKFLDRVATRKYHDLARIIGPKGSRVGGASDGETLAMVAFAYSKFRTAQKEIENSNEYITTSSGVVKKHPAAGEVKIWWDAYQAGLSKLGMSPVARKNVDAMPEEKKKTKKDELAERRALAAEKMRKLKNGTN